jgi:hypothetical protein
MFCILLVLCAAGCIQVEQTLTFHPDGSGVMKLSYGMSQEQVGQLEQAMDEARDLEEEAEGDGTPPDAESPLDFDEDNIREQFKDFHKYGVDLASVKTEVKDGWKFVHMKVEFRSLRGLLQTPLLSDRHVTLKKDPEGNYIFRQTTSDASETGSVAEATPPEMEEVVRELMKGFKLVVNIDTPGEVIDTSAPVKKKKRVTWEFDIDKDPQAVSRAGNLDMWVTFDGQGLDLPEVRAMGPVGK